MASSTMALARAFTKRARRQHEDSTVTDPSYKYGTGSIMRSKISLPTELISTTNVHALSAPDLRSASSTSSNASLRSADESDMAKSPLLTPATSAETSSIDSSPTTPEISHKKFFSSTSAPRRSATTVHRSSSNTSSSSDSAPAIPQRARSHSKKAHQDLARKRSLSRLTPPPSILSGAAVVRTSADMFGPATADPNHPFGKELAQVNEVAEEFGGVAALVDAEEEEMRARGLIKFEAGDYVNEILGLWSGRFDGGVTGIASPWI